MVTIAFIALRLSSRYLGPESPAEVTRVLLKNFTSDWASRQKFARTHTFRYYKYSSRAWVNQVKQQDPNSSNVPIVRDRGTFDRAHEDKKDILGFLQEHRVSLGLTFDGGDKFPCFTVIILADEHVPLLEEDGVGIRMDNSLKPFHVLIRKFDDMVQHICRSWTGLEGLDQELSVKVNWVQSRGYMT
jgi:hypothetical protein